MSTTPTDDDLALVDALGTVAFAITAALTKLGAQHDLSLTQLRLIGILRDRLGVDLVAHWVLLEVDSIPLASSGTPFSAAKQNRISAGESWADQAPPAPGSG